MGNIFPGHTNRLLAIWLAAALVLGACSQPATLEATPAATHTLTPAATATPAGTPTPSFTPTPENSPTPTHEPIPGIDSFIEVGSISLKFGRDAWLSNVLVDENGFPIIEDGHPIRYYEYNMLTLFTTYQGNMDKWRQNKESSLFDQTFELEGAEWPRYRVGISYYYYTKPVILFPFKVRISDKGPFILHDKIRDLHHPLTFKETVIDFSNP